MAERLDGIGEDEHDVLTSARAAEGSSTRAAANEASSEPVNPTAITGEMPLVRPAVLADDTTADALPAFNVADFAGGAAAFESSEPTGPVAFRVTQSLLRGLEVERGNQTITPALADEMLAPARAVATPALADLIESLGGSYPANLAATMLGMTEAELRSSGLIILPDGEVPAFQIRKGKALAGIEEVANAFRAVNPEDIQSVMLLQFCADRLRELGGLSPVQVLKAAHDFALTADGGASNKVLKVAELAKKYPQGGMYALDE